jgi:transcriptional regulator with XRE-family HTH domain
MTQEQLASLAEISAQYVSNIERGKENPTLDLLLRVAAALRVSLPDMFDFEDEGLDRRALQADIRRLLETQDVERLRIALKVLRSIVR